jgi:hypothetical protein
MRGSPPARRNCAYLWLIITWLVAEARQAHPFTPPLIRVPPAKDAALRQGRLRLSELAELAGGIDDSAAEAALSRFGRGSREEQPLQWEVSRIEKTIVKMRDMTPKMTPLMGDRSR